jgi:hypothetical protein
MNLRPVEQAAGLLIRKSGQGLQVITILQMTGNNVIKHYLQLHNSLKG